MIVEQSFRLVTIYAIVRVRDNVVIYVGATFNIRTRQIARYTSAVSNARETEPHRHVAIELCTAADQVAREDYHIELFRMSRHPLLNVAPPVALNSRTKESDLS